MRRRASIVGAAAFAAWLLPSTAHAHGIGGREDLPVPIEYFLVGASVVLVVSFAALAVLWPRPRLQVPLERPLRIPGLAVLRRAFAGVGLLGLFVVLVDGAVGHASRSLSPVVVWIGAWLVVPLLSALVGDLWRTMNPFASLARFAGIGDIERPDRLARVGLWPAAAAFVTFTWFELVHPDPADPRLLTVGAVVYGAWVLAAMAWAGRESGALAFDLFTPYNRLIGALSTIDWNHDGEPRRIGWLRGLPAFPLLPGLTAFVVAMIGTVTYDGLSRASFWTAALGAAVADPWVGTAGLVGAVVLVYAAYLIASWATARLGGAGDARGVAASFAHTLVPIGLAYAVAHYITLVLFEGQLFLSRLSDPFGLGWDLFGTADWKIVFFLGPTAIWWIKVGAVVGGHVLGIVLAHDRALAAFEGERAVRSQYPMLVLMVLLTSLGLFLLAAE